jgi:excisionase family DNA binding protein
MTYVLEPISVGVPHACRLTGISRLRVYQLSDSGELEIVKTGRITLVPVRGLRRLVEPRDN